MGNYVSDPTLKGWLTSILELGAWLGTLLRYSPRRSLSWILLTFCSGFMAETLSRKYGIIVAATVFILGVVIQFTAVG
jgi:hypothetical protein